jgi:hypothetical protein
MISNNHWTVISRTPLGGRRHRWSPSRKKPKKMQTKKMQQMRAMNVDLQQRSREATQPDVCPYALVRGIRWRSTKRKKRRVREFNAAAHRWSSRFSVSCSPPGLAGRAR